MIRVELSKGRYAICDDEDGPLVLPLRWHFLVMDSRRPDERGYAVHAQYSPSRRRTERVLMHRLILGVSAGDHVDHVNRDGLDNRRDNLRRATPLQNAGNRGAIRPGQFRGVFRNEVGNWEAFVGSQPRIYLGTYRTAVEAAAAYDRAALVRYGEYARLNLPEGSRTSERVRKFHSSRFTGVGVHHGRWRAYCVVDGQQRHLGCFATEQEAARAYDEAARSIPRLAGALNFA